MRLYFYHNDRIIERLQHTMLGKKSEGGVTRVLNFNPKDFFIL